jgi:hypothetical protein
MVKELKWFLLHKNVKLFGIMKKNYISPVLTEQNIQQTSVLCSSGAKGDRVSSNIGIGGGDNSGNVADAF